MDALPTGEHCSHLFNISLRICSRSLTPKPVALRAALLLWTSLEASGGYNSTTGELAIRFVVESEANRNL